MNFITLLNDYRNINFYFSTKSVKKLTGDIRKNNATLIAGIYRNVADKLAQNLRDIQKYNKYIIYTYYFGKYSITLHFLVKQGRDANKTRATRMANIINFVIYYLTYLQSKNFAKNYYNINIFIIPTPHKKIFTTNSKLTEANVNSGYTQFSINGEAPYIVLYRAEELYKVLIHELIHFFDKSIIQYPITPYKYYETLTEYHATLIYTYLQLQKSSNTITNKTFLEAIEKQRRYSIRQSAKVLYKLGLHQINMFSLENLQKTSEKQNTHAVEYHLFKASLLYNDTPFFSLFLADYNDLFIENNIEKLLENNIGDFIDSIYKEIEKIKAGKFNKSFKMQFYA